MGAYIKVDLRGVKAKVSPEAFARGKLAMTNQMLLDMEPYVPKMRGDLRASGHAYTDKIVYAMPYARLRYYGWKKPKGFFFSEKQRRYFFANKDELLRHKPTPGTGPRWDVKAKARHMGSWKKVMLKGMGI